MVGQTVQLTCTSVSLPPALFSWQQNGQSVVADQVNGGVLTLRAITTDQSGQYGCVARNAVTAQTAKQSIDITIVSESHHAGSSSLCSLLFASTTHSPPRLSAAPLPETCLSVGAVAGIVVACVLAIIFIIIGIILLLCCRNSACAPMYICDFTSPCLCALFTLY